MTDERIDMEPLAPWRSSPEFESVVQSVTQRAMEARRERESYYFQIDSLAKPALALAASIAIAVWIGAIATQKTSAEQAKPTKKDPAFELASWAASDTVPSTSEIIRVLGGEDEQ